MTDASSSLAEPLAGKLQAQHRRDAHRAGIAAEGLVAVAAAAQAEVATDPTKDLQIHCPDPVRDLALQIFLL